MSGRFMVESFSRVRADPSHCTMCAGSSSRGHGLERTAISDGARGFAIRAGDDAGVGLRGKFPGRLGQKVPVADREEVGLRLRPTHVVKERAGGIDALAD